MHEKVFIEESGAELCVVLGEELLFIREEAVDGRDFIGRRRSVVERILLFSLSFQHVFLTKMLSDLALRRVVLSFKLQLGNFECFTPVVRVTGDHQEDRTSLQLTVLY